MNTPKYVRSFAKAAIKPTPKGEGVEMTLRVRFYHQGMASVEVANPTNQPHYAVQPDQLAATTFVVQLLEAAKEDLKARGRKRVTRHRQETAPRDAA